MLIMQLVLEERYCFRWIAWQMPYKKGMRNCMNQLLLDDEEYYFQISEELGDDKCFILIIYDITDNKRRVKFAKLLEGYGKRVQKSAFEAMLTPQKYDKLVNEIPRFISTKNGEDSVRIYRIIGKGKVTAWGNSPDFEEEIILI